MLSVSGPWTHSRWIVTSCWPVSGSVARTIPRVKYGPASSGVFGGRRDQRADIERSTVHHLLARRITAAEVDGVNGTPDRLEHSEGDALAGRAEQ
jgi:hypothetical protein